MCYSRDNKPSDSNTAMHVGTRVRGQINTCRIFRVCRASSRSGSRYRQRRVCGCLVGRTFFRRRSRDGIRTSRVCPRWWVCAEVTVGFEGPRSASGGGSGKSGDRDGPGRHQHLAFGHGVVIGLVCTRGVSEVSCVFGLFVADPRLSEPTSSSNATNLPVSLTPMADMLSAPVELKRRGESRSNLGRWLYWEWFRGQGISGNGDTLQVDFFGGGRGGDRNSRRREWHLMYFGGGLVMGRCRRYGRCIG